MSEYGNVRIGPPGHLYQGVSGKKVKGPDIAGAQNERTSPAIDANVGRYITTTFGQNLDKTNDFVIPIPVKAREVKLDELGVTASLTQIHLRPDTLEALKGAAKEALRFNQPLVVYNNDGVAIAEIDPKVLLETLKKNSEIPH